MARPVDFTRSELLDCLALPRDMANDTMKVSNVLPPRP